MNPDPLALSLFGWWWWRLILQAEFVSKIKRTLLFAQGRAINFSMVNHMLLAHNKVKRDLFIYTCLNSWCIYLFRTVDVHINKILHFIAIWNHLCCEWHLLLFSWFSFASRSVIIVLSIRFYSFFFPAFESSEINSLK